MAIGAAVISAVGTVASFVGKKKQEKRAEQRHRETIAAQDRKTALEARRQDVLKQRQIRASAAQARRAIAQGEASIHAAGAGGTVTSPSSAQSGVTGNVTSQLNSNNAFVNTVTTLNNQIAQAGADVQNIATRPIGTNSFQTIGAVLQGTGKLVGAIDKAKPGFFDIG